MPPTRAEPDRVSAMPANAPPAGAAPPGQAIDPPGFRQWYDQVAAANGLNPNPDDPLHFYDYRAAYLAGAGPDQTGHWPSQFKRLGHPRLILNGIDTRTGERATPELVAANAQANQLAASGPVPVPRTPGAGGPPAPAPPTPPEAATMGSSAGGRPLTEAAAQRLARVWQEFGPWTGQRERGLKNVPTNVAKGVLGIGPGLTGAAVLAARTVPTLTEAAIGPEPGKTQAAADLAGGLLAAGRITVETAKEAWRDPVGFLEKYPFEIGTAANWAGKAGATAIAGKAETAVAAAEEAGATAPRIASVLARPARAIATRGPIKAAAGAASEAVASHVPLVRALEENWQSWRVTNEIVTKAEQAELIARNRYYKQFWAAWGGLDPEEHGRALAYMTGASGPAESLEPQVAAAAEAWKAVPGQFQNEWLKRNMLSDLTVQTRPYQPARIEEFGRAVPRLMLKQEAQAGAEAAVGAQQAQDMAASFSRYGGDQGPIAPGRLAGVARYLKTIDTNPATADPLAIAKEIFEREAPVAARNGQFPNRLVGDWGATLKATRKGTYQNSPAPLMHQIEGIVKGALAGKEVPWPKGLLPTPSAPLGEMPAVEAEAGRFIASPRAMRMLKGQFLAHLDQETATQMRMPPERLVEFLPEESVPPEALPNPTPSEVAALAEQSPGFRRWLGQKVEGRLQQTRAEQLQRPIPEISTLPPQAAARRVWQMTRDEFDALPEGVRARKLGPYAFVKGMEDPGQQYESVVARAIDAGRPVPRQVLQQNPDWYDAALTPANRRLLHATDEVAADLASKGNDAAIYFPFIRQPASAMMTVRNLFSWSNKATKIKPRSLRQSFGKTYASGEFVKDLRPIAARVTDDFLKYKRAEDIVNGILSDPRTLVRRIKTPLDLHPGEVAWSPDGLRMWRQQVDLGQEFLGHLEHHGVTETGIPQSIGDLIKSGIGEGAWLSTRSGYGQRVIYAIPQSVAGVLKGAYAQAPGFIRNLYDPITGAWRWSVLVARPAWIWNNMIGNVTFATLGGVTPREYLMALNKQFQARVPDELNGIQLTAQEADLGLINNHAGPLGGFLDWLDSKPGAVGIGDALKSPQDALRVVGRIGDPRRIRAGFQAYSRAMTNLNSAGEDYFRNAVYFKKATELARLNYVTRTGDSFYKAFSMLDELDSLAPYQVEEAIKYSNYFMHNYQGLLPWERAWMRRAVPFYNFLKHQVHLMLGLPLDYPGRMAGLQGLVAVGQEAQAYDNALLPDYMKDRGYAYTGVHFVLDGREVNAFVGTTGGNPFTLGWGPQAGSEGVPTDVAGIGGFLYGQSAPLTKYVGLGLHRGFDPQTGQPLTAPGVAYDKDSGKFYSTKPPYDEVPAPFPNVAEFLLGTTPQASMGRRIINPRSGFTGAPLSTKNARELANTTTWIQLLKYFTPVSLILVDAKDPRRPPITFMGARSRAKTILREQRKEAP